MLSLIKNIDNPILQEDLKNFFESIISCYPMILETYGNKLFKYMTLMKDINELEKIQVGYKINFRWWIQY